MIYKDNHSEKGISIQIMLALMSLLAGLFLFFIMRPVFNTFSTYNKNYTGYYANESTQLIDIMTVVTDQGMIVIIALLVVFYMTGRAIFLSDF